MKRRERLGIGSNAMLLETAYFVVVCLSSLSYFWFSVSADIFVREYLSVREVARQYGIRRSTIYLDTC
jgi:hypothetical protein